MPRALADTACPSCDAPAPPGAWRCTRCGYLFLADAGARPRPRIGKRALGTAAAVGAAAIAVLVANAGGGRGDGPSAGITRASSARLEVLSERPLSRPAAERALEERFLPVPDDDEADVSCSGRQARPAHSVRRCQVRYPGGTERLVILITNARGAEVISER